MKLFSNIYENLVLNCASIHTCVRAYVCVCVRVGTRGRALKGVWWRSRHALKRRGLGAEGGAGCWGRDLGKYHAPCCFPALLGCCLRASCSFLCPCTLMFPYSSVLHMEENLWSTSQNNPLLLRVVLFPATRTVAGIGPVVEPRACAWWASPPRPSVLHSA